MGAKTLEMTKSIRFFQSSSELFDSILFDKLPMYKNETEAFLIMSEVSETMLHPMFDVGIEKYVTAVVNSKANAGARFKPLFAVVTGVGRGKTRMLVELQRKLNARPDVFALAVTFNSEWTQVLKLPVDATDFEDPLELQYAVNVVARIISMNYSIPFPKAARLLKLALKNIDTEFADDPSDLIHECVRYIVRQYRASGREINQFVLLVDESVAIQKKLDPDNEEDVHGVLRECLLTRPMNMGDGLPLKVDLVMSG